MSPQHAFPEQFSFLLGGMGYQAVVEWQGNTFVYNPSPAPANLMLDNTRPAPEFIPATEAEWLGGGSSGNTTTKVMTG